MKHRCSPHSSKRWWLSVQVLRRSGEAAWRGYVYRWGPPTPVTAAAKCMLDAAFRLLSQKQDVSRLLSLVGSGADQVILKATAAKGNVGKAGIPILPRVDSYWQVSL